MPTKAFLQSRKEGKKAQAYVFGMFRSWGLEVEETPDGYFPGYDGIVYGPFYGQQVRFRAEVKWDKKCAETGNLYIDINSLRKSQASILTICLNDPIDTILVLPLQDALNYAINHPNVIGGEFKETSCLISKEQFIETLKPKVLTTK